ncbi:MAG: ABC transporter ATP-binding protein, partial [Alphaproteobacteria bacterium]
MLSVRNLHAEIEGKKILKGLNLDLGFGEVHAIMGPNGSGKSTLSYLLAGRPGYEVTQGEIYYKGKNLLELSVEDRSGEGVFLAFQYPVEIPGVSGMSFLRNSLNSVRKYRGQEELSAAEFLKLARGKASELGIDQVML